MDRCVVYKNVVQVEKSSISIAIASMSSNLLFELETNSFAKLVKNGSEGDFSVLGAQKPCRKCLGSWKKYLMRLRGNSASAGHHVVPYILPSRWETSKPRFQCFGEGDIHSSLMCSLFSEVFTKYNPKRKTTKSFQISKYRFSDRVLHPTLRQCPWLETE
jgi:hypothetical protein